MTGETPGVWSWATHETCKEKFIALWTTDYRSMELAVEHYEGNAIEWLHPASALNMASTFFSSACFLLWVHFTPHCKPSASILRYQPPSFKTDPRKAQDLRRRTEVMPVKDPHTRIKMCRRFSTIYD
jgi:hypothetical protein